MMRQRFGVAVVVAVLAIGAAAAARPAPPAPRRGPADLTFEVTARRFEFDPDRIEVIEGDRVTLVLRSTDTAHSIDIKKLGIEREIPRGGQPVTLTFTAPEAGAYPFKCSEYCGRGHRRMRGTLVVRPRSAGGERP